MKNIITFMLEEIKSRMRDIVISLKQISFEMSRCYYIFFEESTVNENRFLNTCNRVHNCQDDDFETIKEKKSIFSKT
jgi:hypothetical protein